MKNKYCLASTVIISSTYTILVTMFYINRNFTLVKKEKLDKIK